MFSVLQGILRDNSQRKADSWSRKSGKTRDQMLFCTGRGPVHPVRSHLLWDLQSSSHSWGREEGASRDSLRGQCWDTTAGPGHCHISGLEKRPETKHFSGTACGCVQNGRQNHLLASPFTDQKLAPRGLHVAQHMFQSARERLFSTLCN